ncbi:DGQHR domain-containing protein [Paenibacillus antri]|uniref:DGQHR domain-containing protein n=1 Tax=Paenibacillus antri TaxID=2582848 RepID=A0A5R9GEC8_9BACL|nr:DGQHR domain-containing protein [Paenibacillus antri]TLS54131.1 DGQHR domain-containing protein [Paenibacillus antri]
MTTYRLEVMRTIQKNQEIFTGFLTKELAQSLTFCDHYPPAPNRLGYQRPPEKKRAIDFAAYLNKNPAGFLTPILLNSREKLGFFPFNTSTSSSFGYVSINGGQNLSIIDGQHRTIGILEHFEQGIEIPFLLFNYLDTEYEEDLFITINREQKKVSMSHVYFVGHKNDVLSELVIRLESDPDSPWYHNVNLVGARGTKRPVSLQSLRASLEELFQSGEVKMLDLEKQYRLAIDFWDVVAQVWPEAWSATRNSLLKKSMGTLAVSKLGSYLIPLVLKRELGEIDKAQLHEYLMRAKHVNWMSDGDFKGYSSRQASDMVKTQLDALIFSPTGAC